ncbi:hypothetical protein OG233_10290 [Streptomyces sp. NBC_01218]|uniref:hypothetical protein n=1 Tax=unclassified Streptomyces TaxID=2593676 RepID=UPI0023B8D959|nr:MULTISPECIES: hypothetical protein [unclassified Streptomyces]WEH39846.1 hypothetical protein PZB77_10120 [Streptomyces sp. AM 2-1-1]WSQ51537.1 hypothetical protein OG233_10290 [Streptomyces sp. NBC_01218]
MNSSTAPDVRPRDPGIDVDAIALAIDHARADRAGLPPRCVVNAGTDELVAHLRRLMSADEYGHDEPDRGAVRLLFRAAYRHLDVAVRPDATTPDAAAYAYWRTVASLTAAFGDLYQEMRQGAGETAEG